MTIFLLLDKSNFKEKVIFVIALKSYSNYYIQFVDKAYNSPIYRSLFSCCQMSNTKKHFECSLITHTVS